MSIRPRITAPEQHHRGLFQMRARKNFLARTLAGAVVVLLAVAEAAAHGELRASTPARNAVVTTPPREVRLVFNNPVNVRFSIFKVYPLQAPADADRQQLNRLARSLVNRVLRKRGDEAYRADRGLATDERETAEIVIRMSEDLEAGHYVVMWRVLWLDGHATQDFFVFTYRPAR